MECLQMKRFKYLVGATAFLLVFTFSALADTVYVSDMNEITLRSGPGAQYKIIALLRTGTQLATLTTSDDWTQIQTSSGKQGWVLTRYLQKDLPAALKLAQLQQKFQRIAARNTRLANDNKSLQEKAGALETELATTRNTAEKLKSDYDTLRKDSTHFIALKTKYKSTAEALDQTKAKAEKIESELNMLYNDKRIWWFLAGGGMLLLGYIFGYSTKPQRRKPSLR
jgi:SH3 domain protein